MKPLKTLIIILYTVTLIVLLSSCTEFMDPFEDSETTDVPVESNDFLESFEKGDLSNANWQILGEESPYVQSEESHTGEYAIRFGDIGDDATSCLLIEKTFDATGVISFYRKTASEFVGDYLKFYIDGVLCGFWSGNNDWTKVTRVVPPGEHTLKWEYEKNAYYSDGEDTAWLDNIKISESEQPGEAISFPDEALKMVLLEALGKTSLMAESRSGERAAPVQIYSDEVSDITELAADDQGITDLSGLEHLTNLNRLHLNENNITDLSPLSGLTELTQLFLMLNNIHDISALSSLSKLKILYVGFNDIDDISSVSSLTNLLWLGFEYNEVEELPDLSELDTLKGIYMYNNAIQDLSPLRQTGEDFMVLNISYNEVIEDFSPISELSGLISLSARQCSIRDISFLSGLDKLAELNINENVIEDISPLEELPKLQYMRLNNNNIADITPLVNNQNIGEGDVINICSNELDLSEGSEDMDIIQTLLNRGVSLDF